MRKLSLIVAVCLLGVNLYADDNKTQKSDYVLTIKTNQDAIDTAGSFSVIKADDIKKMNANSLQNVLENTPGLNVTANIRSIGGRKSITFRGMDPKHTLILVDGNKIANTDALIGMSDFQYNWVAMEDIERIEIIRGPMSSIYGSKALGGVVNIITKKPTENLRAYVDGKLSVAEAGEGISKGISVGASKKIDKFSFAFGAERSRTDMIAKPEQTADLEGKDIANFNLNFNYDITDRDKLSLSFIYGKEIRENQLKTLTFKHYPEYYDIRKNLYSLRYDRDLDFGGLSLKGNYVYTNIYAAQFEATHKTHDTSANAEMFIDYFDNNYIIFGAEYEKNGYIFNPDKDRSCPTGIDHPAFCMPAKYFKKNIQTGSFYLQDEIDIVDRLLLTIGGRYDYHEIFGSKFSPKAYLVYKVANDHRLKIGYGRGFNAPSQKEMSREWKFVNSDPKVQKAFIGNPKLKPETINTYEVGYEFENNEYTLKLTGFYNDFQNMIGTKPTNIPVGAAMSGNYEEYANIAKAITTGSEVEIAKRDFVVDNFDLSLQYTYLYTKDKEQKRELNFRPAHKVNFVADYMFNQYFSTSFKYTYTGEQKNHKIEGGYEYDSILDGFHTFGWYVTSKINKNFSIRGGIENIGDIKLHEDYNYRIEPRTYYVGINYRY